METKADRGKRIANAYREEFNKLSDADILNYTLSINGDSFITLTEHVEKVSSEFEASQVF